MPGDKPVTSWFLAQFKPNSHRIAQRNLERQGFGTFLPLHRETRRKTSRFATDLRPLFPGYVFVAFDACDAQWRAIRSTQGITRLVSFGEKPALVPAALVDALRGRCGADGCLRDAAQLEIGDSVTVTQGPFAAFAATVETIEPDRRVWVLLDLMGRQIRVAVPDTSLRLA